MEPRSKGKVLRLWFVCGLCLCALLAAKWLFFGDAAPRLRLVEEVDCVSGGKPVVVSTQADELLSHTRGYGKSEQRPEDFRLFSACPASKTATFSSGLCCISS